MMSWTFFRSNGSVFSVMFCLADAFLWEMPNRKFTACRMIGDMRLGDLSTLRNSEESDLLIFGVTDDSRDVRHGFLFCAIPGVKDNGLSFCAQAAAKGAQAIAVPEGTRDEEI